MENKTYFGTDGIRGKYPTEINENIAYMTGNYLGSIAGNVQIVVGRDTRVSGTRLKSALINGITDAGGYTLDLDISSSPATAFAVLHTNSAFGVVISASHNPKEYNGIKIFDKNGKKLDSALERQIESHISNQRPIRANQKGKNTKCRRVPLAYQDALVSRIGSLKGLSVALDSANGAVSNTAKKVFKRLGAKVYSFADSANGNQINVGTGALYPEFVADKTVRHKCDCGFSYDGDADRLMGSTETGVVIDGDDILYALALDMQSKNTLADNTVVGTIMTNAGVEKALHQEGIKTVRVDVGDHNIVSYIGEHNLSLGGESSGHIIINDFLPTGDGLFASLQLAKIMLDQNKKMSEIICPVKSYQFNKNIETSNKEIAGSDILAEFLESIKSETSSTGRILVRASGTEPKLRIMTEYDDETTAREIADKICDFVREHFSL